MKRLFVCLTAICVAGAANSQGSIPIGVDAGVFFPQDSTVRNVFGDTWFRVGLTPISLQAPGSWKTTMDIAYLRSSTRFGDSVTLIPLTFGVTRSFGEDQNVRPYVALRAGPYWGDVNSTTLGINKSKVGLDANVAAGLLFQGRFYIEARYDYMSKFEGLNFSGFFLSAGLKLFEIRP